MEFGSCDLYYTSRLGPFFWSEAVPSRAPLRQLAFIWCHTSFQHKGPSGPGVATSPQRTLNISRRLCLLCFPREIYTQGRPNWIISCYIIMTYCRLNVYVYYVFDYVDTRRCIRKSVPQWTVLSPGLCRLHLMAVCINQPAMSLVTPALAQQISSREEHPGSHSRAPCIRVNCILPLRNSPLIAYVKKEKKMCIKISRFAEVVLQKGAKLVLAPLNEPEMRPMD